eukprot:CAMPEP_0203675340 /NCGR_PEP_ID=MMETSP0090-20130426/19841_1 /ASSEMBLY_ACC=CAM_ASM_001088 /TAXON_ID=426623 /ORGANISM="Chaetoceros affinis, Strain CCMP159" /LENGTH=628 /DNA_ID=CAMNT_0050541501 /DNA_START=210 /DNA_END=2096 /DNA_ORIENTATION=-
MPFINKSRSRESTSSNIRNTNSIQQSNTNETNNTGISRRSRGSISRVSTNAFTLENMLLREVQDRKILYDDITKNISTHALAVIFILHIKPRDMNSQKSLAAAAAANTNNNGDGDGKAAMNFQSSKTLDTTVTNQTASSKHINPLEELEVIQAVRTLFESNDLFDDMVSTEGGNNNNNNNKNVRGSGNAKNMGNGKFTLVKYDDKRIFAMCTDPLTAMSKMIFARNLIRDHFRNHPTAIIDLSGGCELGKLFEMVNDYFGDPVNVASKLGEDTAGAGELLVSFGGEEETYIKKFRSRADFIKGSVEVSKVQIDYYFMEEKEPKVGFMEKICCLAGSGSGPLRGGGGGNSKVATRAIVVPETTVAREQAVTNPSPTAYTEDGKYDLSGKPSNDSTLGVDILDENGQNMRHTPQSDLPPQAPMERPTTPPGAGWEEIVMLQSDLSGFTRLTKKYGILHFMTLILQCRKVFNTHLEKYGGEIIKYDGDNIICKFRSNSSLSYDKDGDSAGGGGIYSSSATQRAIQYVLAVRADLDQYNSGREEDFQIRAKIGMAKGAVIVTDDGDIVGDAWEECCELSEGMAKVGEILITEEIKADLEKLEVQFNCEFEARVTGEEEKHEMGTHYNLTLKS